MAVDLTVPLRTALLGASAVTSLLPDYLGSKPIFTRRPAPDNAPFPFIMISNNISLDNEDGVNDRRPVIVRDIAAYGSNEVGNSYQVAEQLGYIIQRMFHRDRYAFVWPVGWSVTQIIATGPIVAPEDDQVAGQVVTLTISMAARGQGPS